jgi:REP element-mobilizing transposase RayT
VVNFETSAEIAAKAAWSGARIMRTAWTQRRTAGQAASGVPQTDAAHAIRERFLLHATMWGRLLTCGRLVIGLVTFLRTFAPNAHILFVDTFHSRRLPHYYSVGRPTFLTWRLQGSLPQGRSFPPALHSGKAFVALDRLLDGARSGPLFLRLPEVAEMVTEAIRCRDPQTYRLHAFVVMPNHVHLLMTPLAPVSQVMQSLKRFTAREGNRMLRLTGRPFWQDESYDRLVRNATEFERIVHYIEWNPVAAGLVTTPEAFPWSSAGADYQSAAG